MIRPLIMAETTPRKQEVTDGKISLPLFTQPARGEEMMRAQRRFALLCFDRRRARPWKSRTKGDNRYISTSQGEETRS